MYDRRYYWRTELLGTEYGVMFPTHMYVIIVQKPIEECAPQNYVVPGRGACAD